MLEILQYIVAQMTADATLTAIVPVANMFTGPIDVLIEAQDELHMPMIVVSTVSEAQRTVPQGARDTTIQIDIWSRNSMLEAEQIYEEIVSLFSFKIANQSSAHIFWERLQGAVDMFEEDRRIWHKAVTVVFWSIKP